jgi:PAS domain S-box-containing protein
MTDTQKPPRRGQETFEAALQAIRDGKIDAVVGRDHLLMLRLRETDERLRLSEARYRGIVESQVEMICRWKPDRTLSFANEAYCRFYGRSPDDLNGQKVPQSVYGPDAELVNRHLECLIRDKSAGEIEHRVAVDNRIYWIQWTDHVIFDAHGNLLEIQSVGRDITESVRTREALRQANQELSEFAYALTHNLKAPLRAVHNYVDFLYEDLADSLAGEAKQYLEGLKHAIHLSNRQFEELQQLYQIKNDLTESNASKIEDLLAEITAALQLDAGRQLITAPQWPPMRCEPQLTRQLLMNLIANGFKFNRSAVKRVEVGWQPAAENRIEIFVRDNGIGIDPRYQAQIFEIFKRLHTEQEFEGTGIGLAIVKKAAARLGGSVRLESARDAGSTFYVNLPLAPPLKAGPGSAGGGELKIAD